MFRKLALAGAFVAMLAGCAAVPIITGQVDNPVTPKAALQLHAGFVAGVVIPAAAYNHLPRCSHNPQPCSEQSVVTKLRVYVNAADATLKKLDQWALGNTSLNGPALYNAAKIAIASATSFAQANGVN